MKPKEEVFAFARSGTPQAYSQEGMLLRDYFAAKALNGIIGTCTGDGTDEGTNKLAKTVAELSYMVADAMMEARKQ